MTNFNTYIQLIKNQAGEVAIQNGTWVYKVGAYWIRFWDNEGIPVDGLEFTHENNKLFWNFLTPQFFYEEYVNDSELAYLEHSIRFQGQPKLMRPGALRGNSPIGSVNFPKEKARGQIFIQGYDIWVKHHDNYPKEGEVSSPSEDSQKGGAIRNDAWLCLKNLTHHLQLGKSDEILTQALVKAQSLYYGADWTDFTEHETTKFFERVIRLVKNTLDISDEITDKIAG